MQQPLYHHNHQGPMSRHEMVASSSSLALNPDSTATKNKKNPKPDADTNPSVAAAAAAAASKAVVDFIGSSTAVKHLFALPLDMNQNVTVALHNLGNGTLMIDNGEFSTLVSTSTDTTAMDYHSTKQRPLLLSPSSTSETLTTLKPTSSALALSAVSSFLRQGPPTTAPTTNNNNKSYIYDDTSATTTTTTTTNNNHTTETNDDTLEQVASTAISCPRQYLYWKLHDYNMCIASDALIYQTSSTSPPSSSSSSVSREAAQSLSASEQPTLTGSQALAIRVVNTGDFLRQQQKPKEERQNQLLPFSYAQVAAAIPQKQHKDHTTTAIGAVEAKPSWKLSPNTSLSYFSQIQLQSTVLPTNSGSTPPSSSSSTLEPPTPERSDNSNKSLSSSAVFTCLDAYLDNIMANVPQLALCLAEKGFIQSIKLLRTEDIPKSMIHIGTQGTTTTTTPSEPLFNPSAVDRNASMLLRFLKQHCSSENSTYLLHREAGQPNIRLYDVTAISQQRQKKWVWWLAMVSYKFALSIQQLLSSRQPHYNQPKPILNKRDLRSRQRNLLLTSIELLEELADMDGAKHETMRATLNEHVADTYLKWDGTAPVGETRQAATVSINDTSKVSLPYQDVNEDCLNKASDYLSKALRILELQLPSSENRTASDTISESTTMEISALSQQLYRIHYKLVHVSLRLADCHFVKYWSSSIIQALRSASRHLAESVSLLDSFNETIADRRVEKIIQNANGQYSAIWAYCGNFARSFAGDSLWRDRGHAMGEDVVNLLQDAENSFLELIREKRQHYLLKEISFIGKSNSNTLTEKTQGRITLFSLSPIILTGFSIHDNTSSFEDASKGRHSKDQSSHAYKDDLLSLIHSAESFLENQSVLKRDKLRILVSAALCYDRASLNKQLGDTCNEIGKIMLSSAREVFTKKQDSADILISGHHSVTKTALSFLHSAEFWFEEGLKNFEQYQDVCNIALLRCNLCQCYKVKANASNLTDVSDSFSEKFLQKAIEHLQHAHTALGEREKDPKTWDVISEELAGAYLALGVRRRQSILGGSNSHGTLPSDTTSTVRLSPGEERSILQPMDSALRIYNKLNNSHQAAAAHYQLALFYTKIWWCQRDEGKTREKLSAAFHHYSASHRYFFNQMKGNEPTFVLLTLDLSNLYSAVSGPECLSKALSCCFDSIYAFSAEAISAAVERRKVNNDSDWFNKMETLAKTLEDQIFRVLHSLVRLEKSGTKFKEMYRVALTSKVSASSKVLESHCIEETCYPIHQVLLDLKSSYDRYFISK